METEIKKVNSKKTGLIIVCSLLGAVMIYYAVMNIIAPIKKMKEINSDYTLIPDEKTKIDERIYSDSAYLKLLKEKAFLQSRIAMAESDSIYLTINIRDSLVNLEISGVVVHKTKIEKMSISRIILDGNDNIISAMLGRPFSIEKSYSTISREPLVIKMAPRDTSEFVPDVPPDTAVYEPVNFVLEMSNGTRIFVYQSEFPNPGDRFHLFKFDMKYRLLNAYDALKSTMLFKVPEYHPFIKLRLPRADVKIIYRALPEHGQIAVYR